MHLFDGLVNDAYDVSLHLVCVGRGGVQLVVRLEKGLSVYPRRPTTASVRLIIILSLPCRCITISSSTTLSSVQFSSEPSSQPTQLCALTLLQANLGDSRSLILHPASTTHGQLTPEQRASKSRIINQNTTMQLWMQDACLLFLSDPSTVGGGKHFSNPAQESLNPFCL